MDLFKESDITIDTLRYVDRYIKKTIRNTKIDYYRKMRRESFDPAELYRLMYPEEPYHFDTELESNNMFLSDTNVTFPRSSLILSLRELTYLQRDVLIQLVINRKSQKEVADKHGISTRMVRKHKVSAIHKLRKLLERKYGPQK